MRLRTWVMRDLDQLQSHHVQGRQHRFHVRTPRAQGAPNRPAVVLVHGLGVSSRYMAPTAACLASRYRVYAPDLPGFGKSTKARAPRDLDDLADTLSEWMDAEGIPRATVIGNSLGCQTIVRFARRYPEKLTGLVLQGPTFDPTGGSAAAQIIRWLRVGSREPSSLPLLLLRDYMDTRPWILLRIARAALRDDLLAQVAEIHVPTLVVRGDKDTIVTQAWAERVADVLPRGRLVTLPGVAHTINYSAPRAFVQALEPFLDACAQQRDGNHGNE